MLNRIFRRFSRDLGIDLGTANTLVYVSGKGIVINEPSVVAINTKTNQILAIGRDAERMVGKTPAHIVAVRPLAEGVISDFEITERMLRYFIRGVHGRTLHAFARPRVVIGIPSGCTDVEKRSVEDAVISAGAREAHLVEEPMAAAIGARLPVQEATGNMIVDIGGGTTEVAVISLGGVVIKRSLRVAGNRLNEDIVRYARTKLNLLIGDRTAERAKKEIGSAYPMKERLETQIRGRDLINGLPKEILINDEQVRQAMARSVKTIVNEIKAAVEETPPEILSDIMKSGIFMAGGGSLLKGIDLRAADDTQMPVHITEDPLTAVVRGTGIILEELDRLREVLVRTSAR